MTRTFKKIGKIVAVSVGIVLMGAVFSGCGSAPECNDEAVKTKVKEGLNVFMQMAMDFTIASGEASKDEADIIQQFLKFNIDSVATELNDKKAKKSVCITKVSIPIPGEKISSTIKYNAKFIDGKKIVVEIEDYGNLFDNL